MATRTVQIPGYGIAVLTEDGDTKQIPGYGIVTNPAVSGRIMGSLAGHGGLAGPGGLAGERGGIAA